MIDSVPSAALQPFGPPVIEIHNVHKAYGSNRVLHGVHLSLPRGAVLGLVGQNGSGKSTLLKCLLGLLRITSGKASVLGEEPWDLSAAAKARIGYVPQKPNLLPWMRCRQMIDYTAAFYPNWNDALVADLCEKWHVPLDQPTGILSVGQAQALSIVLALGHEPELLVLDEPVASLDPLARRQFLRAILEVASDRRRSVLFSTHITSDLERVASHVALLQQGKVALGGELDELKDRVRRVRLTRRGTLPRNVKMAGVLRVRFDGVGGEATVLDCTPELIRDLTTQYGVEIAGVDSLNLEDLFVSLHEE